MVRVRFTLLAALLAWGGGLLADGSATFVLDLRKVKAGLSRTESCALGFSGSFSLDLRGIADTSEIGVVIGSSDAFVLDLRDITASGEDAVVAAFGSGFELDLRNIKEDEPDSSGDADLPEGSSFAFCLDLREIEDASVVCLSSSGFELDLTKIEDVPGVTEASAVVWVASGGFELDLRDIEPVVMCSSVVFLYSDAFELDLRKITVEGVIILPEDITGGASLTISEDWVNKELDEKFGAGTSEKFAQLYGYDFKAALTKETGKYDAHGNALLVWHDYVAGTDPTNPESVFKVSIEMVDGTPVITWDPALNGEGVQTGERIYRIFATNDLNGEWQEVSPDEANGYGFFMVTVEMP